LIKTNSIPVTESLNDPPGKGGVTPAIVGIGTEIANAKSMAAKNKFFILLPPKGYRLACWVNRKQMESHDPLILFWEWGVKGRFAFGNSPDFQSHNWGFAFVAEKRYL
jgi:hypothetical protein